MSRSKSNQETYEIEELGVGCRQETWEINYAYAHLIKEFCEAHDYEPKYYRYHDNLDPSKACAYQRSANLCYDYLATRKLFDRDSQQPIHENLVAVATQYAIAHQFDLERYSQISSHRIAATPDEAYIDVTSLKRREFFYVYLHPEIYDIRKFIKIVERGGTTSYKRGRTVYFPRTTVEESELKVYQKDMVADLRTTVCHTKMASFLKSNLKLSSRIFFDLEIKSLNNERERFEDITRFSNSEKITVENLDERIIRATEAASFFVKACEDLQNLRMKVAASPDLNFKEESYQKALDYFKENAPLHINDEDDETRQLCSLLMEGADTARIATEWQHGYYLKQFSKTA